MAIIDTTRTFATRDIDGTSFGAITLRAFFSRVVEAVQGWNDARATRRSLNALTERELADIGLSRGDIDQIVRTGRMN